MNVLLTGAEGNFGTEFQTLAHRNSQVNVIPVGRKDWAQIDDKLASADVVIHAASDLRTSANLAPRRLLDSNIMSTARLLEAARDQRLKRLVFLSSCAVYGEDMRTAEDSPCCPITINGISKHLNEKLVAQFCSAHDIEYQILRVFNSYGGDDRFSIFSKLKHAVQTNTPFTLNNEGRMQRDFIHVSDVASIVLSLSTAPVLHTLLNIGTGVATKVSSVVDLIAEQFPQLNIQHGTTQEAEYSRADVARLRAVWSDDFTRVESYIADGFARYVADGR